MADDADFFVGRQGTLVHDNTLPELRQAPSTLPPACPPPLLRTTRNPEEADPSFASSCQGSGRNQDDCNGAPFPRFRDRVTGQGTQVTDSLRLAHEPGEAEQSPVGKKKQATPIESTSTSVAIRPTPSSQATVTPAPECAQRNG